MDLNDTSSWVAGGYEWTAFRDAAEPACLIFLAVPCARQSTTNRPGRPKIAKTSQAKPKTEPSS